MAGGGFIFDKTGAKRIVEATRRVEGMPPSGPGRTSGRGSSYAPLDVWLQLKDYDGAPEENTYLVDVYATPYSTRRLNNPVVETKAWNVWELGNSEDQQDGYDISSDANGDAPCGAITGVTPLPGIRYKALGYVYREDDFFFGVWGYIFSERRDPIVKGPTS